jgi:nucleoside phosphorylase
MEISEGTLRVTVFTAIPVETEAMLAQLESFGPQLIGDSVAHIGALKETVASCLVTVIELGPGNIETAMEAGRVRGDGSADILLFVGIAGALKDLALGDVVAAHEVVWLHRAKLVNDEFQYRPQVNQCTRELVQIARFTANQNVWQERLGIPVKKTPKALVGQILSGEQLIKDASYKRALGNRYSDAVAVENEGYGLARAGTASLKVLVIRGVSDHADERKSDSDQATAARSAAAFAAQTLNDYLVLHENAKPATLTLTGQVPPSNEMESTTGYDRAETAVEALRTDVDLVEDDQHAVEEFARTEFAAADQPLRIALVDLLAAEIDDGTNTLVARRLRWYGRVFVNGLFATGADLNWDEVLKSFPTGAAILFSQPDVFRVLEQRERRRVLSGLIGHAESPKTPTTIGWCCLIPIVRAGVLTEREAARVREAQFRTPYPVLAEAGATLQELMPILVEDLESGDYYSQNPAARWLLASGNYQLNDPTLPAEDRGQLAYLLVKAASGGAYGAIDATSRRRMAEWPTDVLAHVLWICLTEGTDRLSSPLERLEDVVAAATLADKLDEVLTLIEQSDRAMTLAPVFDTSAEEDKNWLSHYGRKLSNEAQARWEIFLTRLFEAVPRK